VRRKEQAKAGQIETHANKTPEKYGAGDNFSGSVLQIM